MYIEADAPVVVPSETSTFEDLINHGQDSFSRELKELLQPSEQINHQSGLNLVNTRLWIKEICEKYGPTVTIDTVPSQEWSSLFEMYDSFWFMGIYTPSNASRELAKNYSHEYRNALPDLDPERDIAASPFAVPEYNPNPLIAKDWDTWDTMVEMLHTHGKKVILDFIPNHVALDHPWAKEHPEYFIQGNQQQVLSNPDLYYQVTAADGKVYNLAHGKDPSFAGWTDTLQLNYAMEEVQKKMKQVLFKVLDHADGARCDMASLIYPEKFLETWGEHLSENQKQYIAQTNFWGNAIPEAKERAKLLGKEKPILIAETYTHLDELGQYFDYLYNDAFYKQLGRIVNDHEDPTYLTTHLQHLLTTVLRFVLYTENHDEPRAASIFGEKPAKAAAVVAGLVPDSIFLINQGQEEGRRIRPPMQINRFPPEQTDKKTQAFYERFLRFKHSRLVQEGNCHMAPISKNDPSINDTSIIALEINSPDGTMNAIVCTNFGNSIARCRLPEIDAKKDVKLYNLIDGGTVQNPDMVRQEGMFVELDPWATQIFFYR